MRRALPTWLLSVAERVYRLLLVAYPRSFRRAYGSPMVQVFRDSCRAAYQRGGAPALAALWVHTLGDLIASALRERFTAACWPRCATPAAALPPARGAWGGSALDSLTRRVRQSLQLAAAEAGALGHPAVGAEHLLLGLIRERGGVAGLVLRDLGVTLEQARRAAADLDAAAPADPTDLTQQIDQALTGAQIEAQRLGHRYIGTEHVLLALLRDPQGAAARALDRLGLTPERVIASVEQTITRKEAR